MLGAAEKKLIKLGGGLYVAIPAMFARLNKLSKGDCLRVEWGYRTLKIRRPDKKKGQAK